MKYDFTKKSTIGATRTLNALRQAMLAQLSSKSFEDITVGELCEKAIVPRATFYNYFDDKYDLLEYCLMTARRQLDSDDLETENCVRRMDTFLDNCFDFLDRNEETVQNILKNNRPNQFFLNQLRFYLLTSMSAAFQDCPDTNCYHIPQEMAANLYSQVVLIILEWKYLDKKECSKEQAKDYLHQMVSGVEKG